MFMSTFISAIETSLFRFRVVGIVAIRRAAFASTTRSIYGKVEKSRDYLCIYRNIYVNVAAITAAIQFSDLRQKLT